MEKFWYGVAYYREYLAEERLQEDIALMKAAGINYVRIAESTWSTFEPQEGSLISVRSPRFLTPCMKIILR